MKRFITSPNNRRRLTGLLAAVFWLLVWEVAARLVGKEILLVPPERVFTRLLELGRTAAFWRTAGKTLARIFSGFALSALAGVALASLSAWNRYARSLIRPFITLIQSTPVASFTIIALLWVRAANLSVPVSFLMALPIFYVGTLEGIECVDKRLLDMARLFEVPWPRRLGVVYARSVLPYFLTAASGALGIAWKSGVSAEVIGLPSGSIGQRLQQAKLFLETADLFAWTAVIVILSALTERILRYVARRVAGEPS